MTPPRDNGVAGTVLGYQRIHPAPREKAGGSRRGWQCNECAGPLQRRVQRWEGEGNTSLPTVNTALGVAQSLLPFWSCRRPGLSARLAARASALAHGQESLLIPGKQEAVEEVGGTLAVLLSLLCHQVGWRAQEEAGEQGGCGGRPNSLLLRNGDLARRQEGVTVQRGQQEWSRETTHLPIMATLTLLSSEYLSSSRRNDIRYRNTLRWQRGS